VAKRPAFTIAVTSSSDGRCCYTARCKPPRGGCGDELTAPISVALKKRCRKRSFSKPAVAVVCLLLTAILSSARAEQRHQGLERSGVQARGETGFPSPLRFSLTALPAYGRAPLSVALFLNTRSREGDGPLLYRWDFGDGEVSASPPLPLFHTYKTPGNYLVTVTVTAPDGRVASAFRAVIVLPSNPR